MQNGFYNPVSLLLSSVAARLCTVRFMDMVKKCWEMFSGKLSGHVADFVRMPQRYPKDAGMARSGRPVKLSELLSSRSEKGL